MTQVLVIGAGVGGLVTAAALAQAGVQVTVLEAQVYPGGCASTFFHQNYRFDAGATLAGGFYPGGPMDRVAQATGIMSWPVRPVNTAMVVHLPGGPPIQRWTDERRWDERREAFGTPGHSFWRWQEQRADALWDLALRSPAWPPGTLTEGLELVRTGVAWLGRHWRQAKPSLAADALRPVAAHLRDAPDRLRLFVDAQLLISAQTTAAYANALYGAASLDLPRRGVVQLEGGMGSIAETLVRAIRRNEGRVLFRQEVTRIDWRPGGTSVVETKRGERFSAAKVVANLPLWNVARLLGGPTPPALRRLPERPEDGWGAFVLYVGIDGASVPLDGPLHHQVVVQEPLGEGNSVFISISPGWDATRAPAGRRAVTISTHTRLAPWWHLLAHDRAMYEAHKEAYTERVLKAATVALPYLRDAARLVLPGTPVTFQRFTRRDWGWVGGYPQTNLARAKRSRLGPGLWMVGDSVFPGQSTAAVALGGLHVARQVLKALDPVSELVANRCEVRL